LPYQAGRFTELDMDQKYRVILKWKVGRRCLELFYKQRRPYAPMPE
jgi:hypothetical protein